MGIQVRGWRASQRSGQLPKGMMLTMSRACLVGRRMVWEFSTTSTLCSSHTRSYHSIASITSVDIGWDERQALACYLTYTERSLVACIEAGSASCTVHRQPH